MELITYLYFVPPNALTPRIYSSSVVSLGMNANSMPKEMDLVVLALSYYFLQSMGFNTRNHCFDETW